ncbi:uncharacterized protein [Arachis hypogaea]|uniref:uncharacterized protein n=1 Tax=Arachis hypogaea TaxID=3818 RepID=UPI003B221150
MKRQADSHRREKSFNIGDLVLLKLQTYRQGSVVTRGHLKLGKKYFGPFKVLQRVRTVAYKLELPVGSAIHPVFYVSLLKEFKSESIVAGGINELPLSLPFEPVPIAIIDTRTLQLDDGSQDVQVLVEWQGALREEVTWVSWTELVRMYPAEDFEDKVIVIERVIDTNNSIYDGLNTPIADSAIHNGPNTPITDPTRKKTRKSLV